MREFDAGSDYNVWKTGDKHSMVVRFVHHTRSELAGQSDKITLDLTDNDIESMDRETDVLPGLTIVVRGVTSIQELETIT